MVVAAITIAVFFLNWIGFGTCNVCNIATFISPAPGASYLGIPMITVDGPSNIQIGLSLYFPRTGMRKWLSPALSVPVVIELLLPGHVMFEPIHLFVHTDVDNDIATRCGFPRDAEGRAVVASVAIDITPWDFLRQDSVRPTPRKLLPAHVLDPALPSVAVVCADSLGINLMQCSPLVYAQDYPNLGALAAYDMSHAPIGNSHYQLVTDSLAMVLLDGHHKGLLWNVFALLLHSSSANVFVAPLREDLSYANFVSTIANIFEAHVRTDFVVMPDGDRGDGRIVAVSRALMEQTDIEDWGVESTQSDSHRYLQWEKETLRRWTAAGRRGVQLAPDLTESGDGPDNEWQKVLYTPRDSVFESVNDNAMMGSSARSWKSPQCLSVAIPEDILIAHVRMSLSALLVQFKIRYACSDSRWLQSARDANEVATEASFSSDAYRCACARAWQLDPSNVEFAQRVLLLFSGRSEFFSNSIFIPYALLFKYGKMVGFDEGRSLWWGAAGHILSQMGGMPCSHHAVHLLTKAIDSYDEDARALSGGGLTRERLEAELRHIRRLEGAIDGIASADTPNSILYPWTVEPNPPTPNCDQEVSSRDTCSSSSCPLCECGRGAGNLTHDDSEGGSLPAQPASRKGPEKHQEVMPLLWRADAATPINEGYWQVHEGASSHIEWIVDGRPFGTAVQIDDLVQNVKSAGRTVWWHFLGDSRARNLFWYLAAELGGLREELPWLQLGALPVRLSHPRHSGCWSRICENGGAKEIGLTYSQCVGLYHTKRLEGPIPDGWQVDEDLLKMTLEKEHFLGEYSCMLVFDLGENAKLRISYDWQKTFGTSSDIDGTYDERLVHAAGFRPDLLVVGPTHDVHNWSRQYRNTKSGSTTEFYPGWEVDKTRRGVDMFARRWATWHCEVSPGTAIILLDTPPQSKHENPEVTFALSAFLTSYLDRVTWARHCHDTKYNCPWASGAVPELSYVQSLELPGRWMLPLRLSSLVSPATLGILREKLILEDAVHVTDAVNNVLLNAIIQLVPSFDESKV
eukprot:Rmarinus@m.2276